MSDLKCLESFSPIVKDWFLEHVGEPSEPQKRGWPEIAVGRNVLICAPTGSGKTFAAFLKCLDLIYAAKKPETRNTGVRIVYISPLKALNNDIYRNLEVPVKGIRERAVAAGLSLPDIDIAVRTGDTPQKDRSRMQRQPPDILITTPESLFIMLTADSYRKLFSTVEYVIVDEIHSICAGKRGVHLSVSLERLERLAGRPLRRIGLTATVNPLEEAARFLAGRVPPEGPEAWGSRDFRDISVINCDRKRKLELTVSLPVKDFKVLPENTVWPSVYAQLMTLVGTAKSTLIFVNNRRTAEMVAAGLNKLAGEPFVKTHHGSVSREVRQELEKQLKEGEITCLVATSSLELGIDIGSIELVIQISAPSSVSQVLQRIGRSGHRLEAVSKGCIIPRTRGDLLKAAFIAGQAGKYNIESITVPRNCLDVLAQQITSIACEGEQDVREVYETVCGAYPYNGLPFKQFEEVLEMLSDPSPSDAPGTVKPRAVYDKGSGKLRSTALGRRMCLMNGGTIPDKGNYSVYLKDTNIKLGELQEEFVFESRLGERFFLGSSVWKLDKIEHDRVIVTPSVDPGAKIPFWIGDQTLRNYETGVLLGEFLQQLEEKYRQSGFEDWMRSECGLDRTAADNLRQYVSDQLDHTGRLPGSRLILCEHFSDETGDRRMIIHSPFGGRVHAALSVILHSRLEKLLNCRIEYVYNDDGILFHIAGYTGKLSNIFSLLAGENLEDDVFELLTEAPLFNINLRYNLTRSLLVESKGFGKRTPLWVQRLRSAEIAQYVLTKPDHPAVVETYRECMNDVFDIKSLYKLMKNISAGDIKTLDVYTDRPSPFSSELLFSFWQIYQYAYDLPVAERRNQLLVNDRDFIQLAAGLDGEYELMDPRAVTAVEKELSDFKYNRKIKDADELYYFIYSFGELKAGPYSDGLFPELSAEECMELLGQLEDQGRIIRLEINQSGESYWIAAGDYPLYCRVMGREMAAAQVLVGLPGKERLVNAAEWFNSYILELKPEPAEAAVRIIRRYTTGIGPFKTADILDRYSMKREFVLAAIGRLEAGGELLRLKNADNVDEVIYCNRKVYERIKRKTVILARSDIKPKEPEFYCSYLLEHHEIGLDVMPPEEKLEKAIGILQGLFLPAGWWENFVFPSRIKRYDPKLLDYLCSTGVVKWVGRVNKNTNETAFFLQQEAEDARAYPAEMADGESALSEFEKEICGILAEKGACFLKDLTKATGIGAADLLSRLERLVWSGILTNDAYSVVRYYLDMGKKNSPWAKYNTYPNMGRWYLCGNTSLPHGGNGLRLHIDRMLGRYGVLSKEIADCEKDIFKWGDIYGYLKANEFGSGIKRGFYVSGLAGIQFARDRELELIRMQDSGDRGERYVTLCSCDPANPYKDILYKVSPVKTPKNPGTAIVFGNGRPVLVLKDFGNSILPLTEDRDIIVKAAASFVESFTSRSLWSSRKSIFMEYWGKAGEEMCKIEDAPIYEELLDLGFDRGYSGITLWRKV